MTDLHGLQAYFADTLDTTTPPDQPGKSKSLKDLQRKQGYVSCPACHGFLANQCTTCYGMGMVRINDTADIVAVLTSMQDRIATLEAQVAELTRRLHDMEGGN